MAGGDRGGQTVLARRAALAALPLRLKRVQADSEAGRSERRCGLEVIHGVAVSVEEMWCNV